MQRIASRWRFLTLAVPAGLTAALLALALLGGGAGGRHTLATGPTPGPTPDLTGVSCADVYVDLNDNGIADDLNGDSMITAADISSLSMNRTEPSQTQAGKWDVTTVSYLGKPSPGGLVPGGPPGPSCASTTAAAATAPEANVFGGPFQVAYTNQYGVRPTSIDTYTSVGDGTGHLTGSSCGYTEGQSAWVRIDTDTHITKTGKGAANTGAGVLYLGTGAPTSGGIDTNGDGVINATTDGTSCTTPGSFAYHFVYTAYSQNATTDHPELSKNTGIAQDPLTLDEAQAAGTCSPNPAPAGGGGSAVLTYNTGTNLLTWSITFGNLSGAPTAAHFHSPAGIEVTIADLTSPSVGSAVLTAGQETDLLAGVWYMNYHTAACPSGEIRGQVLVTPKVKGANQYSDGPDGLADDWDGDGCPNWDELGKGYMAQTPTPFPLHYPPVYDWNTNPVNGMDPFNPNDCNLNFDSNISLETTILHNTGGAGSVAVGCNFGQIIGNTCPNGNGQYFRCLADVTDGKGAGNRPLTFRLGCYSDSTLTVVNTNYDRAYDPTLGEDGYPANSCSDGLNNSLTTPTPPATPDLVSDRLDSDCHASTCPGALPDMCGDGKSGSPPPGCQTAPTSVPTATPVPPCTSLPNAVAAGASHCPAELIPPPPTPGLRTVKINCAPQRWNYTAITAAEYPVLAVGDATNNYYDATANQIHIGGCFAGFGGSVFGPNIFGEGLIDAHTGAGSFKLWIQLTSPTCVHSGDPSITGSVTIVELQSKKYVNGPNVGTPLPCAPAAPPCLLLDSDKDGCPDSFELEGPAQLANAQRNGGLRDPYNKYDYFDPTHDRVHTAADMSAVVSKFGKNEWRKTLADPDVIEPNPLYNPDMDRTAVAGASAWNLGPPNGLVSAEDILAAVKSFGNNCPHA